MLDLCLRTFRILKEFKYWLMWNQSCSECSKGTSVNHSYMHTFFSPENFIKAMENDVEMRRVRRLEKEKKATGLWFFFCLFLMHDYTLCCVSILYFQHPVLFVSLQPWKTGGMKLMQKKTLKLPSSITQRVYLKCRTCSPCTPIAHKWF